MDQWEDFGCNYFIILPIFPPSSHPKVVFLSCRPFVVNTTFSTGLVGIEEDTNVGWDNGGKIGKLI